MAKHIDDRLDLYTVRNPVVRTGFLALWFLKQPIDSSWYVRDKFHKDSFADRRKMESREVRLGLW